MSPDIVNNSNKYREMFCDIRNEATFQLRVIRASKNVMFEGIRVSLCSILFNNNKNNPMMYSESGKSLHSLCSLWFKRCILILLWKIYESLFKNIFITSMVSISKFGSLFKHLITIICSCDTATCTNAHVKEIVWTIT